MTDELGGVLVALHDAPRLRSLHLRGELRSDSAARSRWLGSFMSDVSTGQDVVFGTAFGGSVGSSRPEWASADVELWYEATDPASWRVDRGDSVTVVSGDRVVRRHAGQAVGSARATGGVHHGTGMEHVWDGSTLTAVYSLADPEDTDLLGRRCWRVAATARGIPDRARNLSIPLRLTLPGDRLDVWVDRDTGVVLSWVAWVGDERLVEFEPDLVEVDQPIDPAIFSLEPQDGVPVMTQEQWVGQSYAQSRVESRPLDPGERGRQRFPFGSRFEPFSLEARIASHLPVGPPPEHEEDARIDVGLAFERMLDVDGDCGGLSSVQGGEDLGEPLALAMQRVPAGYDLRIEVSGIRFLRPDEAVVGFRLDRTPLEIEREGRAVLIDGAWMVTRATVVDLLAIAGVDCPPAPD